MGFRNDLPEACRPASDAHRGDDDHLTVGGHLERRVGVDSSHIEQALVEDQGQAVTRFREFLDHLRRNLQYVQTMAPVRTCQRTPPGLGWETSHAAAEGCITTAAPSS